MLQSRMFSSLARLVRKRSKTMSNSRLIYDIVTKPLVVSISCETASDKASTLLLDGRVIALPTDTIYGLAVSAQNNYGIGKLYEIKKREPKKPISICVADTNEVSLYGETSHLENDLVNSLLPGPVTVVLKRKPLLNSVLNPNTNLVGIRVPKSVFVKNVTRLCGGPIALTSANLSCEPSALQINDFSHLWPCLSGIFDGGVLGSNRAGSTVIDLSEPGYFKILRDGCALDSTLAIVEKFGIKKKLHQ